MRILALNWRDPRNPEAGGAEVHLHEILKRSAASGHRVTQISHAVTGLPAEEWIDGVRILRHGRRNTFNFTLKRFALSLDIGSNFDLVIEDLCKVPFYSPRWSPAPVLTVVPHLFGTTAFREVAFPLALYVNFMESFIPRAYRGSRFVAISDSTKRDLVRRGISDGEISVIPCGIDTAFYTPGPPDPDPATFLYVGRLKKYKGIQMIITALGLLRQTGTDCSLVVLGSGDYEGELRKLTARLGLEGSVSFEGFVAQERKLHWLRRAWAAVFPSEKEGWGLTVIEANACGTPVIASDSDGLRDSVRNGETGILVPHGDLEALASEMGKLSADPARRSLLGNNGIKWAGSFDWDITAERMLRVMEETASSRSHVPR
ncbi:MAG: glycosyltransferase family 4 protein [Candidatus Fermentibacteraceae bacterium]|nr:glycosyltransferase family 4 protein [Candidatus Fermentibacteraceae bacterium]MBN2607517.1 glycosyltransferase family 4 protein [Candidatus Fermentibacteraceae bacterium]